MPFTKWRRHAGQCRETATSDMKCLNIRHNLSVTTSLHRSKLDCVARQYSILLQFTTVLNKSSQAPS